MNTSKVATRFAKRLLSSQPSYFVRQNLWTPDNVVRTPFRDVELPDLTVSEYIWNTIGKWSDKTALTCAITNRSYTFNQLYKYSRTFAANLRSKLKIATGDVVCVMMQNSPDYGILTLGTIEAGAELTTVNPIYTAYELQRQISLSKPKLIIGSIGTVNVIKEALKQAKLKLPIIIITNPGESLPEGTISFKELIEDNLVDYSVLKTVKRRGEDTAILPYSSGTTGLPKGVELTNTNIVVNCIQQDVEGVKQYDETTASHQDSVVAVLPFYHIYGLLIVMMHKLSVGAKIVTLPKFQPDTFLNTLRDHRISLLYAAPPTILFIGSHPGAKKEHLATINRIMSGAAPLPKHDINEALKKMKPSTKFLHLYGLTETSPLVTTNIEGATDYASAGYAISNTELKIVDSELKALGPNELGELLIRGPQVMKGYRNNPEATKGCITEDGWFKSGDLAFLDEKGTVTIADRLKELIKVKGFQVAPAELEGILKEHPAVLDAGVIGIPDQRSGEVPKAFIVLQDGQTQDVADNILDFVKERVAEFKRIKEITFLESLPKNPSGKLLRRVLKEKQ